MIDLKPKISFTVTKTKEHQDTWNEQKHPDRSTSHEHLPQAILLPGHDYGYNESFKSFEVHLHNVSVPNCITNMPTISLIAFNNTQSRR